jgi:uncharacterized protein (TIGR02147 family)
VSIFNFQDYRKFIAVVLEGLPGKGRGEQAKIAQALGVNTSFLSQVLKGTKNFSQEQAFLLGQYFGFNELETRYLEEMVNLSRAGKSAYRKSIEARLEKMGIEAKRKEGIPSLDQPLDEPNQAIFYSSWQYSAIQLLTGIERLQTPDAIAQRLKIDQKSTQQILDFLTLCGLCTNESGRYQVGTRRTHLTDHSPLRSRHHMNWRLKAIDHFPISNPGDLFFTGPMRVDAPTLEKIEKLLRELLKEVNGLIDQASDETVACLNIDWFKF